MAEQRANQSRSGGGRPSNRPAGSGRSHSRTNRRPSAPRPALARPAPLPSAGSALRHDPRGRLLVAAPLIVVVLGAVLAAVGVLVAGLVLIVLALAALAIGAIVGAPGRLVTSLGGRVAVEESDARLLNVTEGLCVANGLAVPRLVVVEDPAPNALALGHSLETATLVFTSGLLAQLDRMELEAVVAHELAHLKRGDNRAAAFATMSLGAVALVLSPGRVFRRVGDPAREVEADLFASAMTRYPPALRQVLEKLEAAPTTQPKSTTRRVAALTGPFWCAPAGVAAAPRPLPGVLDLELRAAALAEL